MPFFSPMQQKSQAARHGQAGSEEGAAAPPLPPPPPPPPAAQPTLSDGPEPSLRGEWWNMWLLLTLYFLQGIPIGLASSIPLLLLSRGASYADQALYSFSSYPYSLKWLWAPVVDALHTQRWGLGKRKSWVVPCQLATGAVMMVVAAHVDRLLPSEGAVDVPGLLAAFLVLYFLVATQDIAVDGWALELLRPENVGYASTANTVGQGVGIQAAFSIFLAMDSADVCNTYIRPALGLPPSSAGMVTLGGFLWAWGAVFLVVTLAVWALKHEAPEAAAAAAAAEALPAPAPARRSSSRSSRSSSSSSNSGSSSSSAGAAAVEEGGFSDAEETEALVQGGAAGLRERKKSNSRSGSEEGRSRAREAAAAPASSASASSDGEAQRKAPAAPVAAPAPPPAVPASSLAALHASYQDFFSTCFLPNIFSLAVVLLTFKAGFAAVDATTTFVLQERGVPKETLAFIDTISFPLQLAIQILFIASWTAGPKSLDIFVWAFPLRAASGLGQLAMVYLLLPNRALEPWSTATMPAHAVAVIFVLSNAHSAIQSLQFMAQMSFFSRVAKQSPSNSATVMTLLNALTNLGSMWPRPLILWAMEALSSKQCLARGGGEALAGAGVGACNSAEASTACKGLGGLCVSVVSGYPVVVALGTAYCAAWWWAMRARVTKLASAPASGWTLAR